MQTIKTKVIVTIKRITRELYNLIREFDNCHFYKIISVAPMQLNVVRAALGRHTRPKKSLPHKTVDKQIFREGDIDPTILISDRLSRLALRENEESVRMPVPPTSRLL